MKVANRLFVVLNLVCCALLQAQNSFLIDTNVTYMPEPSGQSHAAVAFDGTNYFVVWDDWSKGIPYHNDMSMHYNLIGSRVTPEGIVLDSAGIPISYFVQIAGYPYCQPAIAYGDGVFFVVWQDFRQDIGGDIYGARIDTNGIVLDPNGFSISSIPVALQSSPSITFDGTNFFVAWFDKRIPTGSIYGCRIKTDGTILDPLGIQISTSGEYPFVSVSFDGTNYFAVWGNPDIFGARVDTTGVLIDTNAIAIATGPDDESYPAVTFGGTYHFVTWQNSLVPISNIHGARVDTMGILVDTTSIVISTLPRSQRPDVAFNGMHYLITWTDYLNAYCARVETSGVLIDSAGIVVAQDSASEASLAFDGVNHFVVWHDNSVVDGEIFGARVDTAGVVIDTVSIHLSMCAYTGRSSSASFDGTNYFAVWEDHRNSSGSVIYGSRIDTLGAILDPDGIPLIDGKNPTVAFDGTNYFAVCSGVKGVRIDTTAAIIDTIDVFLSGGDYPALLFDGTNYFAVWEYSNDIYGARIDTSGVVLDSNAIVISNGPFYEIGPAVAFDGTNYFVVWHYGTFVTTFDIHGARVDTMGNVIDTISILIATGAHRQCFPTVSFDGLNYFVAWEDRRNGYSDLYGTRITQNGIVLDSAGIPLCVAPSGQYLPEIKFDGLNYCMVWEDWRNSDYTDIYGCDINPSGAVISEYVVSNQPKHQLQPVLAEGIDKFLLTYTGFVDSIGNRAANTRRIWGKFQRFTNINEESNYKQPMEVCDFEIDPNPSRNMFKVRFNSPDERAVLVKLYDVVGRLTEKVFVGKAKIGVNEFLINPKDLSAGVYFVRVETTNYKKTEKVILLR